MIKHPNSYLVWIYEEKEIMLFVKPIEIKAKVKPTCLNTTKSCWK